MDSQPPGAPCISVTHHSLTHKQAAGEEVSFSLQVLEQLSGNAAEREGLSSPGIMSRRDCVSLKKYSPVLGVRAGLWRLQLWMCPLDTPVFLQRGTGKGCGRNRANQLQGSSSALQCQGSLFNLPPLLISQEKGRILRRNCQHFSSCLVFPS